MLKPVKIVFSLTGVYVMIKLFDFLLERTRIKESEKTSRAKINRGQNNSTTKKRVQKTETKKKEYAKK